MKKNAVCTFLLSLLAASAAARPVPPLAWRGNPLGWLPKGERTVATGVTGFATADGFVRGREMTIAAEITPTAIASNNVQYATFGVAGVDTADRYWHLAFVRKPVASGGTCLFELAMRFGKDWPAQYRRKLKELPGSLRDGRWEFGKNYRLELRFSDGRVSGLVTDSAGTVIFRQTFAARGKGVDGGAPALHATGGFSATVHAVDAESASPLPDLPPEPRQVFPAYANGPKPVSDTQYRATGFFRLEKAGDRWITVDPNGREVVPLGVNSVNYAGCISRGPRRRYLEWNRAHYASRTDWEVETLDRLRDWGFNRVSGGNTNLYRRGFMHSYNLNLGSRLCGPGMPEEFWICPNPGKPCAAFPNVFHPRFRAWCDFVARERCAPFRDDPWLFGYYMDNELAWWGRGARDTGLYNETLKLPAGHSARAALENFARARGVAPEKASAADRLDFLRIAADIYFRECAAAIRAADPNHLVLGARFAGLSGAHETVWEISGKHCDLVTFNIYPWADLDRNVVMVSSSASAQRVADAFAERYAVVRKPFLVTEWSFPSLDSGLPCTKGAGQRFDTQAQRTQATELFARTMLASPAIIGYDYFMWVDEPPEGVSDPHPEDTNYGLVSEEGRPYPLTGMFARLHADIPAVRAAGMPAERPAPPAAPAPAVSAARAALAARPAAAGGALAFPEPKRGNGPVLSGVTLADGRPLGDFALMLSYMRRGVRHWTRCRRVLDVRKIDVRTVEVTCEGLGPKGSAFTFTAQLSFYPEQATVLADIVELRNTGTEPLEVRGVYFRPEAPFAGNDSAKLVPNRWNAPKAACWTAPDGRWWGASSEAATARRFSFTYSAERKSMHPDALFEPAAPLVLKPGETYRPDGTMWCRIEGGAR